MRGPLLTIGYEQASSQAVLDALRGAGAQLVIDTRAVAASRRPGFSKRQLAAGLDQHGIAYLHLRSLGTPKEGRVAARSGQVDELFRVYEAHLATPPAQEQLDELSAIVKSGTRVCLLCYERDVAHCHRKRIAEIVRERVGVEVEHLVPPLF
jgi:uncharacterized protein (DUF488 family)